jgi:hypothetical protein
MAEQSKKNLLLLSGSKAAGGLPAGEKPGLLISPKIGLKNVLQPQLLKRNLFCLCPMPVPAACLKKIM